MQVLSDECFLLSSALLSLLGSCLWYDLEFDDFLMDSVFGPFCGIFRAVECPARWRDLRYVVQAFAASSLPSGGQLRSFSDLRRSRSRRLLRGGACTDCAVQWSPGILSRSLPGRSVEEGQVLCWCVWSLRGGDVSTLRVGCGILLASAKGTQTRTNSTREKKDHSANTRVARTHGTRVHVASLALNPWRYVNE